jgi:hypothetical protein
LPLLLLLFFICFPFLSIGAYPLPVINVIPRRKNSALIFRRKAFHWVVFLPILFIPAPTPILL